MIPLDHAIMREIYSDPFSRFELVEADIQALPERTKHMFVLDFFKFLIPRTIVDYAEATALYMQSLMSKNASHKQRLFDLVKFLEISDPVGNEAI